MNQSSKIILIFFILYFPFNLFAQDKTQSISFFILKENTPTSAKNLINPFYTPYYFGGSFAYEWGRKKTNVFSFQHLFQLGYYHHKRLHQNIFLMWKPKFQWTVFNHLNIKLFPGIGYSHTFPTQATYQLKDGKFEHKANYGKAHAIASAGFGLGFNISSDKEIIINSEAMFIFPYAPNGTIPLYLSTIFSAGIKINL